LGRQQHAILVGGDNRLKPALRLMSDYRLVIEEIKEAKAITSYTRWVDAVQARGVENPEMSGGLTFPSLQRLQRTMPFTKAPPLDSGQVRDRE
jgi:hypothetical protein